MGMGYKDQNGNPIREGMMLLFSDGTYEKVCATVNSYGEDDLGINASNEDYLRAHGLGEMDREYYSLSNFSAKDMLIVSEPAIAQEIPQNTTDPGKSSGAGSGDAGGKPHFLLLKLPLPGSRVNPQFCVNTI